MAKRPPLAGFVVEKTKDEQTANVFGLDVLYTFEEGDPSVGICDAYYVTAVKVGGQWLSAVDTFNEDFVDVLCDAVGEQVRAAAEDDFDIPEEA